MAGRKGIKQTEEWIRKRMVAHRGKHFDNVNAMLGIKLGGEANQT